MNCNITTLLYLSVVSQCYTSLLPQRCTSELYRGVTALSLYISDVVPLCWNQSCTAVLYIGAVPLCLPWCCTSVLYCGVIPQFCTTVLYLSVVPQCYTSVLNGLDDGPWRCTSMLYHIVLLLYCTSVLHHDVVPR